MSSVQSLREFVNKRLTVATEEILGVFEQTVRVYEEEINRQRKLLDMVLKPEIKLHRTEIPQSVYNDQVLADQQLCNQERNSGVDQEDQEPPQIKEEQEEQLILEQESELCEFKPSGEGLTNISVEAIKSESGTDDFCQAQPNGDQHLAHNSHRAESQDSARENASSDGKPENKHFECHFCTEEFHDVLGLKSHRCTHLSRKLFKCDTCGRRFPEKKYLTRHMIIHAGVKAFRCGVCGKGFTRQSHCNTHMKSHSDVKPHLCPTCGKRFTLSASLRRHIRSHTGEKPYSCVNCGRGFSDSSNLCAHIRVHTGEKPYCCTWCGKRFSLSSTLKKHTRLHTGEKPYECDICGRNFAQNSTLKSHKRIHAEDKQQN